jgi:uncharacterized repeat protein (TIGR03803 family)
MIRERSFTSYSSYFSYLLTIASVLIATLMVLAALLALVQIAQAQNATYTVLHKFSGYADGRTPYSSLVLDAAGNLYGTTAGGGLCFNCTPSGVVFKLDPTGRETVLHTFTGGTDGAYPYAGVVLDAAGNLYGTTINGGRCCGYGYGVVFKLDPAGHETVLYTFTGGTDGSNPYGGVIFDAAGNLYGTTQSGGADFAGTVFKLDPAGHETVLHSFNGTDGAYP